MTEIVDELYNSIKSLVNDELDITKLMQITTTLMQVVETYSELKGQEKKGLILQVIDKISEELPEGTAKDVVKTTRPIIPNIIDTVISVDKGELKIKAKRIWKRIREKLSKIKCCC